MCYTLYCKESNMYCVALDIYIVLHRVYTLCCIEPNIHCVSCVIYIVLHRLYTLHCIVRCYTMYITVRKCIYGYNTMYVPNVHSNAHLYTLCYNDNMYIHWVTCGIHCSTFHMCCDHVTQCISRCSPMYILLGYLCWVYTLCIYIGVHCPHIHWVYTL